MSQFKDHIRLRFGQEKADQFARLFGGAKHSPGICYDCTKGRCLTLSMLQQMNEQEYVPEASTIAAHAYLIFEHEFLISFTLLDVNIADPGGGGGGGG